MEGEEENARLRQNLINLLNYGLGVNSTSEVEQTTVQEILPDIDNEPTTGVKRKRRVRIRVPQAECIQRSVSAIEKALEVSTTDRFRKKIYKFLKVKNTEDAANVLSSKLTGFFDTHPFDLLPSRTISETGSSSTVFTPEEEEDILTNPSDIKLEMSSTASECASSQYLSSSPSSSQSQISENGNEKKVRVVDVKYW